MISKMYNVCRYIVKGVFFTVSNLYALPTYLIWMTLLTPLRFACPSLYWRLEAQMSKMLQLICVTWLDTGGYKVIESGEDIGVISTVESLVICNHQSTADTPLLFYAYWPKNMASGTMMWILWVGFRFTNFGMVAMHRADFLIDQGNKVRDLQLVRLKRHLETKYVSHRRKWIMVFPEGGFLYKRLESSQRYAKKNDYPVLQHTTLPRVGAVKTILDTVGVPYEPHVQQEEKDGAETSKAEVAQEGEGGPLKYVIDTTLAYHKGKPLDFLGMSFGWDKPEDVLVHHRVYKVSEIPRDEPSLTKWLYDRYVEKENLLDYYYKHGELSKEVLDAPTLLPKIKTRYVRFDLIHQLLVHVFFMTTCYVFHYVAAKPAIGLCYDLMEYLPWR